MFKKLRFRYWLKYLMAPAIAYTAREVNKEGRLNEFPWEIIMETCYAEMRNRGIEHLSEKDAQKFKRAFCGTMAKLVGKEMTTALTPSFAMTKAFWEPDYKNCLQFKSMKYILESLSRKVKERLRSLDPETRNELAKSFIDAQEIDIDNANFISNDQKDELKRIVNQVF